MNFIPTLQTWLELHQNCVIYVLKYWVFLIRYYLIQISLDLNSCKFPNSLTWNYSWEASSLACVCIILVCGSFVFKERSHKLVTQDENMKHFDTNQRTMTQGHAMVQTAMSLRHNLSDLFCLPDEVNTHLSVFIRKTVIMNGRCLSQQSRGHCRNNFVVNDFPVLVHTASL